MKSKPSRSDIFVFGGGIGGISAAISAARKGALVQLVDSLHELGGCIGENFQMPMDFPSSTNDPFFRESGIFEEIVTCLRIENKEGTYAGQARALFSLVKKEPNIMLLLGYHCLEAKLNATNNRIDSCTIANFNEGSKYLHRAEYFIDCSDDGNLSKLVNAPGETRIPLKSSGEKTDQIFYKSAALIEIEKTDHKIPFICPEGVPFKWEDNLISAKIAWMESLQKNLCGFHHIEWIGEDSQIPNSNELCWAAWDFIKNRSSLKKMSSGLFIKRIIPLKANHSIFRGTGDYQLSQDDLLKLKTYPDSVVVCRSPISEGKSSPLSSLKRVILADSFEIPLRALYSNKIKNLLWAGSHASCDNTTSETLFHPPTFSQMGFVVGHCAAHCITEKRLPRTIAKAGHIEKFRKDLERNNHRTGKLIFEDEDNLMHLAKVSASTTWQQSSILEIPTEQGIETNLCLIQFPLTTSHLDHIKLLIGCSKPFSLDARLLAGSNQNYHIPGPCIQIDSLEVSQAKEQWITFNFNTKIEHKGWYFLELRSKENFWVMEAENAPVGHLIQYPRKIYGLPEDNPYSEYCPPPSYSPQPHRSAVIEVSPPQKTYEAHEMLTENSRPSVLPSLWISQPTNFSYPEFIEFNWPKTIKISRLDLFFDPCFGYLTHAHPTYTPHSRAISLVKDYKIYFTSAEGKSSLVNEISNNYSSYRTHDYEACEINSLEVEILSTHGLDRAQIFRIAAYE